MSLNSGRKSFGTRPLFTRKRIVGTIACVVGLVILACVVFAGAVWVRISTFPLTTPKDGETDDVVYLLVGTDAGIERHETELQYSPPGEEDPRADIIFLFRLGEDGQATMVPVPRDVLAPREEGAPIRLALHLLQGPQQLADAVCGALGVGVDRYVSIDAAGFVDAVDALGGIEADIPYPVRDWRAKLDLPAGVQRLGGDDALALVRSRHPEFQMSSGWTQADDAGAAQRLESSADVLEQLRYEASNASLVTLAKTAWAASGHVTVGGGFHPGELRDMAQTRVSTVTIPVEDEAKTRAIQVHPEAEQVLQQAGFDTSCVYPEESPNAPKPNPFAPPPESDEPDSSNAP